jgi:FtsP/CotA-like multicopper oxidase with cupredoxin domain
MNRTRLLLALASLGLACSSSHSNNARSPATTAAPLASPDVFLQAQTFVIPANSFNNPAPITMWGYAKCTANFASCGTATAPGPTIAATEGTSLTIHLRNTLTGPLVEPVSVIAPGQLATMAPVWIDPSTGTVTATGARPPGDYTSRVRSFTAETPAGNATEVTYTWTNLKAGTFLYQSGTHPQVQVQMGLYGALQVYPATTGRAYADPSSAYDSEVTLLYSEIDPVLHQAIASGTYGPNPNAPLDPPAGWLTSTVDYRPQYFLVNGHPFASTAAPIAGGAVGKKTLLRFLNAGLSSKVPTLLGAYVSEIGEDGNFISITNAAGTTVAAPREQYSVFLPAGKTIDAIFTPSAAGTVAVFDRRMNLSNAGVSPGGQLTYLAVGP